MLKKKDRESKLFYQFDLETFVPEDHFLRKVNKNISFEFIREKVRHLYSHTGQPAIDPVVLIKMLLIGYFYDIKSERQLEKEIQVNLAYRWFIGYDIDEQIPDHSVISQTRRRKFSESGLFQEIFDEIVKKLLDMGLVEGTTILTDSTHIKANASMRSMTPTAEYLANLDRNEEKDDKKNNDDHYSKTDPDSKMMSRPGKPGGLHYLEHRSIDSSGFITDVCVTPGNVNDHLPYVDRIKRQMEVFGFDIRNCVADKGYGRNIVYQKLTDMSIRAFIPTKVNGNKSKYEFKPDDFVFDPNKDIYVCPEGKSLIKRKNIHKRDRAYVYSCSFKNCSNCPSREKCIGKEHKVAKSIERSIYQEAVDFQLSKTGSDEWKEMLKLRKWLMEGSFADAKVNHSLGRAKMRGLKNVSEQSLMTAVAQNIKRMLVSLYKKKQASLRTLASCIEKYLRTYFISLSFLDC